ncbi:hypothetical protein [Raoultella planticola]|uniref:hypothetical protein n=1 Tax=Raoultella planticola TaxID=575 RepID=UPI003A4C7681
MAISDISKAVSVKDQDVFLVEVVDGKPVVKQITEDFVIISSGDIPSNREEFMHFNEKYLAPNGVGIDINSLSDDKIEKYINVLKESLSKEGANKQVISSQADSLIKISRIWADFFPANNRISLFRLFFPPFLALFPVFTEISPTDVSFGPPETGWPG